MEGCKRSTQETEIEVIRRKVVLMRAGCAGLKLTGCGGTKMKAYQRLTRRFGK